MLQVRVHLKVIERGDMFSQGGWEIQGGWFLDSSMATAQLWRLRENAVPAPAWPQGRLHPISPEPGAEWPFQGAAMPGISVGCSRGDFSTGPPVPGPDLHVSRVPISNVCLVSPHPHFSTAEFLFLLFLIHTFSCFSFSLHSMFLTFDT